MSTEPIPLRISFLGGNPLHLAFARGLSHGLADHEGVTIDTFYTLGLETTRQYFEQARGRAPFTIQDLPMLLPSLRFLRKALAARQVLTRTVEAAFSRRLPGEVNVLLLGTEWGVVPPAFVSLWRRQGGIVLLMDEWSLFPFAREYAQLDRKNSLRWTLFAKALFPGAARVKRYSFFKHPSDCNLIEDAYFHGALMVRKPGFETGRNFPAYYMGSPITAEVTNRYRLVVYGIVDDTFGLTTRAQWSEAVKAVVNRFLAHALPSQICYKFHPMEKDPALVAFLEEKRVVLDSVTPGEELVAANPGAVHLSCSSTVIGHAAMIGCLGVALYPMLYHSEQHKFMYDLFYRGSDLKVMHSEAEFQAWLEGLETLPSPPDRTAAQKSAFIGLAQFLRQLAAGDAASARRLEGARQAP